MVEDKSTNGVLFTVISEVAGEDAVKVASTLLNEEWLTDESIASKTMLKLNQVRKILYSLLDNGLVTYRKVHDENIGWYTYYWALNKENLETLLLLKKRLVLKKLNERLKFEEEHNLYRCPNCEESLLTFEEAVDTYFRCPTCGQQLEVYENSLIIEVLKRKIKTLESEIEK